jgi:hypothetical protein
MTFVLLIPVDSLLRCCWMVYGTTNGLEFSTLWNCYALHLCASGGIYVAGSWLVFLADLDTSVSHFLRFSNIHSAKLLMLFTLNHLFLWSKFPLIHQTILLCEQLHMLIGLIFFLIFVWSLLDAYFEPIIFCLYPGWNFKLFQGFHAYSMLPHSRSKFLCTCW